MDLILANGEKIVKEFEYGERKAKGLFAGKKHNVKRSLIVTNKRIISQSAGTNTTARKEIPLSAADYVTSSFSKVQRSIVPAILFAVLGLILLIVGLVLKAPQDKPAAVENILKIVFMVLGGVFLLLALIFLIIFLVNRSAGVEIVIAGRCLETQLMSVASTNIKPSKKVKLFKIIVRKEVAFPMINELGALILDLKAGNVPGEAK